MSPTNFMGERVKVSVCMATYNGERFVREQIESVLRELSEIDEFIIVDDCSRDSTVDIIEEYSGGSVNLYRNDTNLGVVKTFEKAINLASGEVIFLCDQDDVWYKGKVDEMLCVIKESNSVAVVSDCNLINERGDITQSSFFERRGSRSGFLNNLFRNGYLGCAMCFRADLKGVVLPFPKSISMHDEWIGLVGDLAGRVAFSKAVLFGYRRHDKNVSALHWGGIVFALKKRILHAIYLIFRLPLIIRYKRSLEANK